MVKVTKLSDDGEPVVSSLDEDAEAIAMLKGIFDGSVKMEIDPLALEDLKRMGLTEDELLAMLAKDLGVDN